MKEIDETFFLNSLLSYCLVCFQLKNSFFFFAEKTKETRATITILLAVSLGLIVVCLILISMSLAYFSKM